MKMKASDWIIQFLEQQGVRVVFEVAGGMIAHLLDSLAQQSTIRVVSMHHEQAAAFAAEGVARMTGVPGVALATSGPGATNLLTAIGSLYFDSYPAVFITGQVNRSELKGQKAIRQLGFQELDVVAVARPLTKAAWEAHSAEELPDRLASAFRIATHSRPGPVLLDIPMDVQRQELECPAIVGMPQPPSVPSASPKDLAKVLALLQHAARPLILAGGGIRSARAVAQFRRLVDALGIPVVHSLQAVDILSYDHPLRVGMIGSYGNRWANYAVANSDFLLVLGSRLDVRQTGAQTLAFKGDKTIVHVDCEAAEINNRVLGCEAIIAELPSFLSALVEQVAPTHPDYTEWSEDIRAHKAKWPDTGELREIVGINPNLFIRKLSPHAKPASAWVVDVGQHQMWAAQSVELGPTQRFLTSGGMGAMGFALPAAIGAALSDPTRPVACISGDGGFQMNIQELETVSRLRLPIKLIVMDNRSLGMVRQFQSDNFDSRFQSTIWGYGAPDFCAVAEAYGLEARAVESESSVDCALDWLWADPATPALLRVSIDPTANAYPKMAFGKTIDQMYPPTD